MLLFHFFFPSPHLIPQFSPKQVRRRRSLGPIKPVIIGRHLFFHSIERTNERGLKKNEEEEEENGVGRRKGATYERQTHTCCLALERKVLEIRIQEVHWFSFLVAVGYARSDNCTVPNRMRPSIRQGQSRSAIGDVGSHFPLPPYGVFPRVIWLQDRKGRRCIIVTFSLSLSFSLIPVG